MAPPPKKKIRLTFMWADEAAVVQDFNAKYSEKLVEWAGAFYGKYGFELDVQPAPGGKAQEANRYTLAKTDGYEPDIASAEEFWERLFKLKKPTLREWIQADRDIDALAQQEQDKQQEISAELGRFSTMPMPDWPAQVTKLTTLFGEYEIITADLAAKRQLYKDLEAKLDAFDARHKKESDARNFDIPVRTRIGEKLVRSLDLRPIVPIKTGNENPDIVDPTRLKIIFCRFRLAPSLMVVRPGPQPFGTTRDSIQPNSAGGQYLWDGPFILLNLNRHEQITLAHEMVHAAGRSHIPDVVRMKDLRGWIRTITADPVTQKIELPPIYESAWGGFYDGPEDDIINYHSKGKKPDEVKLYPDDVKRMEDAFFVKEPPPASPP